jgi:anti-sigma regulatory factor (Ser/Thr protein kinase)
MTSDTRSPAMPGFVHSAVIIDSGQTVREVLAPAVREALAEADGVFMAVSDDTARLLREELGTADGKLEWGDASALYQRLGFTYESVRRILAAARAAGRRIHFFAEPDVVDEAAAVDRTAAYLAYEAICNETYAAYGCEVTCLWDARRHPTLMIENVRSLHSHELGPAGREPSPGFVAPWQYLAGRNQLPLAPPARADWDTSLASLDAIPPLRAALRDWALRHGFTSSAAADVVLAVTEVAANGLTHGRTPVTVHGWHQRDTLVAEVDDRGGRPLPATAGYRPPGEHRNSRRGLWLARQLADVVQTHTADATTSVRLYFPRRLTHSNPRRASGTAGRRPAPRR